MAHLGQRFCITARRLDKAPVLAEDVELPPAVEKDSSSPLTSTQDRTGRGRKRKIFPVPPERTNDRVRASDAITTRTVQLKTNE